MFDQEIEHREALKNNEQLISTLQEIVSYVHTFEEIYIGKTTFSKVLSQTTIILYMYR